MAILVGVVHGFSNGIALQAGPGVVGLLGIMVALIVLVALVSTLIISLRAPWLRIAVRVMGSWMCAFGILTFGWFLQGGMS